VPTRRSGSRVGQKAIDHGWTPSTSPEPEAAFGRLDHDRTVRRQRRPVMGGGAGSPLTPPGAPLCPCFGYQHNADANPRRRTCLTLTR
jgi:hypothetical protein